jgi:hypothetical protein
MSARSDALAAQLAALRSKSERREAIERFEAGQMSTAEVRQLQQFRNWLALAGERRAAAEGTATAGGDLLPTRWNSALIQQTVEYAGLMNSFERWNSPHGGPAQRPLANVPPAAAAVAELGTVAEADTTFAQQVWSDTPMYAAAMTVSLEVVMDALRAGNEEPGHDGGVIGSGGFVGLNGNLGHPDSAPIVDPSNPPLDDLVRDALSVSLGRAVAPVAQAAVYSAQTVSWAAGNSGGVFNLTAATPVQLTSGASTELAQQTIALDTAAQIIATVDPSYLSGAAWYVTPVGFEGLVRQVDSQKRFVLQPDGTRTLFGYPVNVTAGVSNSLASTASGPIFGNLRAGMTLRVANGSTQLLRSSERHADALETYYRASVRMDVGPRDVRAYTVVKYQAT